MNELTLAYLEKVALTLKRICPETSGKRFCVCLSGGADSTALLAAMNMLKESMAFYLCAAHVNHLLRGEESFRDENFCVNLCGELGIELFYTRIDIKKLSVKTKKSVEETARDARYGYFTELDKKQRLDLFLTAHTRNDNAETVLMNIIRGTAPSGICGIPEKNKKIIRPLLDIDRKENLAFLEDNGLNYVTDSSNADNAYTRNYVRNTLLPAMNRINQKATDAVNRLSAYATDDEDYFTKALELLPSETEDKALHPALLRRRLQREYSRITGGKSLMSVHLDALVRLPDKGTGKRLNMPCGITALVRDGRITLEKDTTLKKITDKGIYELKYGENNFAGGMVSIFLSDNYPDDVQNIYNIYTHIKLSFDRIIGSIKYRARQTGDKIFCLGVNKSIKKEFISKGIPSYLREAVPIFYDDLGIIYVPYVGAADRVYTADKDRSSIFITVRFNERQDLTDEE